MTDVRIEAREALEVRSVLASDPASWPSPPTSDPVRERRDARLVWSSGLTPCR